MLQPVSTPVGSDVTGVISMDTVGGTIAATPISRTTAWRHKRKLQASAAALHAQQPQPAVLQLVES